MFLKVFELLINARFFHSKAVIILQFYLSPLGLNLVDEILELLVDHFDVLDASYFHLFVEVVPLGDILLCLR